MPLGSVGISRPRNREAQSTPVTKSTAPKRTSIKAMRIFVTFSTKRTALSFLPYIHANGKESAKISTQLIERGKLMPASDAIFCSASVPSAYWPKVKVQ